MRSDGLGVCALSNIGTPPRALCRPHTVPLRADTRVHAQPRLLTQGLAQSSVKPQQP